MKSRRQFPAVGFCDTFALSIETTFIEFVLFTLQLSLLFTKYTQLFFLCALSCISLFAAILPNMISRRTGQIVLINSIQGKIGIPFRAACKLYIAKTYIVMHKLGGIHDTHHRLLKVLICIQIPYYYSIWLIFSQIGTQLGKMLPLKCNCCLEVLE